MVILCRVELDIKVMYEAKLLHAPMECGSQNIFGVVELAVQK